MSSNRIFVCKCIRLIDGMPSIFNYIGPWYGWKKINPEVSVLSWRAAS